MTSFSQGFPMGVGSPLSTNGNDFQINDKLYPGLVLNPINTEQNGLYSAFREINGAQWMLQNADISVASGPFLINAGQPAKAFVLLAGGGLAMYTAPANSPSGFTWTRQFYVDNAGVLQSPTAEGNEFTFNVQDYGAKGDGVTDDTVAIQSAITAAISAGGGEILFPATSAVYLLSSTAGNPAFTIANQANLVFRGVGSGSTLKLSSATPASAWVFQFTNCSGIVMRDLVIAGGGASAGNGVGFVYTGLVQAVAGCTNFRFENVTFNKAPIGMLAFDGCSYMRVEDCHFNNSGFGATGAFFDPMLALGVNNQSNHCWVLNCDFQNGLWHGIWGLASDTIVDNCTFSSVGEARIVMGNNRFTVNNCKDFNGYIVSSSGSFIETFCDDVTITNNQIFNAGQTPGRFGLNPNECGGIFCAGGNAVIVGNTIVNCTAGGIFPWKDIQGSFNPLSGQNITVANNVVVGNATLSTQNAGSNGFGGILFTDISGGNYANVTVNGNTCSGNGGMGDLFVSIPINTGTFSVRGNSCFPESIVLGAANLTGSTAFTQVANVPVAANAMLSNGGIKVTAHTVGVLAAGTGKIVASHGGNSLVVLTNTYTVGDHITYSLSSSGFSTINVMYTVVIGSTSLNAIATGVAAAINSAIGNTFVTAQVTTTQASNIAANTPSAIILITATSAAFALGVSVQNTATTTSGTGSVTCSDSQVINTLISFTTGSAPGTESFRLDARVINSINTGLQTTGVQLWTGTTLASNVCSSSGIDTSIPQTFQIFLQLSNGADAFDDIATIYERL